MIYTKTGIGTGWNLFSSRDWCSTDANFCEISQNSPLQDGRQGLGLRMALAALPPGPANTFLHSLRSAAQTKNTDALQAAFCRTTAAVCEV